MNKSSYRSNLIISISIILITLNFSSCIDISNEYRAENGVFDLSRPGSIDQAVINITGDFAFFWNEFIGSENLSQYDVSKAEEFIFVPSYWTPYGKGYGVYSLRIILPEDVPEYIGIKMTNVLENYSLYANGKLVHQVGVPGVTKESSVWESAPALLSIPAEGEYLDLKFQVSVFHDVVGGLSRNIYIGDIESLKHMRERRLALDALIIGAMLLIGLYHLLLSGMLFKEPRSTSYFFLGLVFILIILFIGSKDELLFKTLFDGFNSIIRSRFIYSTLVVSVPFFYCYIYFVFPEYLPKKIFRTVVIISAIEWLIIILSPVAFYTKLLIPFEVFSLVVSIHVASHLLFHLIRVKRLIILAFLAGYLMLITGIVFGMLDNYMLVPAWSPGVCFLIFGVFQTVVQAYNTSRAYHQITMLNQAFIEMEKETEKLYDLSYIDQLTSLANRRYLNEYMHKLWDRNSMTSVDIGLIIIDIDYFKLYNDRYGHLAGDNCLVKVAAALRESMNRRGDFVARYGGEEFVAVISKCPESELLKIADRMRMNIINLGIEHIDSACSEYVTISAGLSSLIPASGQNWLKLFKQADDALYTAKADGRNRVVNFEDQ